MTAMFLQDQAFNQYDCTLTTCLQFLQHFQVENYKQKNIEIC